MSLSVSVRHSGIFRVPFPPAPGGRQPLAGSQLWGVSSSGGGGRHPGRSKRLGRRRLVLPGSLHCSATGTASAPRPSRVGAWGAPLREPGPGGGGAGGGSTPAPPPRAPEPAGPWVPARRRQGFIPARRVACGAGRRSRPCAPSPSSLQLEQLGGCGRERAGRVAGGTRRGEGAAAQPIGATAGAPPPPLVPTPRPHSQL